MKPEHPLISERANFIQFYLKIYTAIFLMISGFSVWMFYLWSEHPAAPNSSFLLNIATIPSVVFTGYFFYLMLSKWVESYDNESRLKLHSLGVNDSDIPSADPLKALIRVASIVCFLIAVGFVMLQIKQL